MALVVTVGSATADSYVTLAEADTYFAANSHLLASTWAALTDDQQEACLRTAARQFNELRWWGKEVTTTQALAFPRYYYNNGWTTTTAIPTQIKRAQMEQALFLAGNLATGGQSKRQRLQAEGVKAYSVGDLSETFAEGRVGSVGALAPATKLGPDVLTLLHGCIKTTGSVIAEQRLS